MNFIEEEDYIAGLLNLLNQLLQVFFKAAPVLGTGFQTGNVNTDDLLILNRRRYIPVDNRLS